MQLLSIEHAQNASRVEVRGPTFGIYPGCCSFVSMSQQSFGSYAGSQSSVERIRMASIECRLSAMLAGGRATDSKTG